MFIPIVRLFIVFQLTSASSINLQKFCTNGTIANACKIDGTNLSDEVEPIEILETQRGYAKIELINFKIWQPEKIFKSLHVNELIVTSSSFKMDRILPVKYFDARSFYLQLSNITISNGGFACFKNLQFLQFTDVIFESLEEAGFDGIDSLVSFGLIHTNITSEVIGAFKTLPSVKNFICTKCELNDDGLMDILDNQRHLQDITLQHNQIKVLKCNMVNHWKLLKIFLNNNQLSESFSTCKIRVVNVKDNRIETLHIQSNTKSIEADRNNISVIKCDDSLDLVLLTLENNNLEDLMCISTIISLEELIINKNKFTHFRSSSFDALRNLKYISAMNNKFTSYSPKLFASINKSNLKRINVDQFDFGYEYLSYIYPKLVEIFHKKFNGSCEKLFEMKESLKVQNIELNFFDGWKCENGTKN